MKKLLSLLFSTALSLTIVFAQAPQGIAYQAIAFTTGGQPVINGNVGVKISILNGSATGTVAYAETHTKTTNSQGLFDLNIGQGAVVSGSFSSVAWGSGSKFLKVEIDPAGGSNYTITGSNQLMSVPYALYSENTNVTNIGTTIQSVDKTGDMLVVYTSSNAYAFHKSGSSGYWEQQSLSGTVVGAIACKNSIVVYTTSNAYAFHKSGSSGYWEQQSLSGNTLGAAASDSSIAVYTTSNAYAFHKSGSSGYWEQQSLSGTGQGTANSKDAIVVYTSSNSYAFYFSGSSGYWEQQSLSGTALGAAGCAGSIVVYTTSNAYAFHRSGSSGYWEQQSLSGTPINAVGK